MTLMTADRIRKENDTYHHGDLREALLSSAESILRRDGIGALSLRAMARAAGVSHAAPAHHFPDLSSLLSALAAEGFDRLADELIETRQKGGDIPIELGKTYIEFSKRNSALFQLMSDPGRVDSRHPALQAARKRALSVLAGTRGATMQNPTLTQVGEMVANWGLIHGLALLLSTGRLGTLLRVAPEGTTEMDLIVAAMNSMRRPG